MRLASTTICCLLLSTLLLQSCISNGDKVSPTIAELQHKTENINPKVEFPQGKLQRGELQIDNQQLMDSYQQLVLITPQGGQYGKETQRLADLELEASIDNTLSENDATVVRGEQQLQSAIDRYEQYLKDYPDRVENDLILYQLSRAYAFDGQPDIAQDYMRQLIRRYPLSRYIDEVQFRLGENYFVSGSYAKAELAYGAVVNLYPDSVFYEKSLYKLGWSQFKQNKNTQAIHSYVQLLDLKQAERMLGETELADSLSRSEQELVEDVLRVTSLAFSYLEDKQAIAQYFNRTGHRLYEPLLYAEQAELYLSKDRLTDAADVYLSYAQHYPNYRFAPVFHQKAIDIYKTSAFSSLLLPEKENYVKKYNRGTIFWELQEESTHDELQPLLTGHMSDIATHYHATARANQKWANQKGANQKSVNQKKASKKRDSKTSADYKLAASWYQLYLDSFPKDKRAAEINFLLAESRYDARQYPQAIAEYNKTAYAYPTHKNSAEAAYAALISYNELYQVSEREMRPQIHEQLIQSSLKFSYFFPDDKRMPDVLLKTAEQFFDLKKYNQAFIAAERLVNNPQVDEKIKHRAWILIAHSHFELQQYFAAENAYLQVIAGMPEGSQSTKKMSKKDSAKYYKDRKNMQEQLASSIYKQGELEREAGNHQLAAAHFLRVGKRVPGSSIHIIADYDAATEYLALQQWPELINLLEKFRKTYPEQKKWRQGVSQKLALAYNSSGQYAKAADEMMTLGSLSPKDQQQNLLWQSAALYSQAGDEKKTIGLYKTYIKKYPQPLSKTIELRHKIASYYLAKDDTKRYHYWLKEIVKADTQAANQADNGGGNQRTDRTRYLAATASLELIKPVHASYSKVKLTTPLKKSLQKKKSLMKQSVAAYTKAARYQVEEVTTAATFNIAEIYSEFAVALLESERPEKLNEEELEEYNYLLEDQAYPFEEKAIKIHEANLSRIPKGSFDDSIKNSLLALSKLMPFRYAKSEITDSYVK